MNERNYMSELAVKFGVAIQYFAVFFIFTVSAQANTFLPVEVNGHVYSAILESKGINGAAASSSSGEHYTGVLQDADGWVRASKINGLWQGLLSIQGELYAFSGLVGNVEGKGTSAKSSPRRVVAQPVASLSDEPHLCGADSAGQSAPLSILQSGKTTSSNATLSEASFSSLCVANVDGVCLLAELELVFDQQFVAGFSSLAAAEAEAQSIINMVEGYYLNDLNIAFNVITMEFLDRLVFSSTTDATDLIDDVRDLKFSNSLSFLNNDQALLHLVTGRDLNGNTAGIAFENGLCNNFGFGVGLSNYIDAGRFSAAVTALIVAHEIGHNFGADHDGDSDGDGASCLTNAFIMTPELNFSNDLSSFSSCSIASMENAISAINIPAACFDFPVDLDLQTTVQSSQQADQFSVFEHVISFSTEFASERPNDISLTATITSGTVTVNDVLVDGASCQINNTVNGFTCPIAAGSASIRMSYTATSADNVSVSYSVATGDSELVEINRNNNSVNVDTVISAATEPEPEPEPEEPPSPSGQTQTESDAESSGGSMGLLTVFTLMLFARFSRRNIMV